MQGTRKIIARRPKRQRLRLWWLLVGIALVLVLGACQGSATPTAAPAAPATAQPTAVAEEPTPVVQAEPTQAPTEEPTQAPTEEPTQAPTEVPPAEPTAEPTEEAAQPVAAGDPLNGAYLATLTGGCGCHMNRELGALAGGNRFEGPFGVVYSPNITPDLETGIGTLTAQQIALLLQIGAGPGGEQLVPAMPYMDFSALSDKEALDVAAYLLSLEPVANAVPPRELVSEPAPFTPAQAPPAEPPTDPIARGQELVTIARCGSCHTPPNADGSPNREMTLAGAPLRDEFAANLTPDESTGLGRWSLEQIASFLRTGTYPDGSLVAGAMGQQITRRFSTLTEEDAMAIAAYLKSLPPIVNARP